MIRIWTDGSCNPNPGPGGWGAIIVFADGREREMFGAEKDTTNNRMEMTAAVKVFEWITIRPARIELFTDSQYLQRGISLWIRGWKRNGWKTKAGEPVKNADLWSRLDLACATHSIRWRWVRGHNGDPMNERADALAGRAMRAGLAA